MGTSVRHVLLCVRAWHNFGPVCECVALLSDFVCGRGFWMGFDVEECVLCVCGV
jgi:hypothetical protein